jgi:hypothetical protein
MFISVLYLFQQHGRPESQSPSTTTTDVTTAIATIGYIIQRRSPSYADRPSASRIRRQKESKGSSSCYYSTSFKFTTTPRATQYQ